MKTTLAHSGFTLTKDIKQYVDKRFGKLDRYIGRKHRASVHAEIKLKEEKGKKKNKCTAEVILHIPDKTLTAKESTVNIFAAIDIVEAKLVNQLRKHKDKRSNHRANRRNVLRRFQRLADRDFRNRQN